jgi:hypothetical protein
MIRTRSAALALAGTEFPSNGASGISVQITLSERPAPVPGHVVLTWRAPGAL